MGTDHTGSGHLQPLLQYPHQRRSSSIVSATDDVEGLTTGAPSGFGSSSSTAPRPLSSGWATALAAASVAGSMKVAARKRATQAMVGAAGSVRGGVGIGGGGGVTGGVKPSRSLFCLSHSNPVRKLTVSVVEWKYPYQANQRSRYYCDIV